MAASSKLLLFLFVLITIAQIYLNWTRIAELSAEKHRLETQIQTFRREFHWAERGRSSNGGEQNDLDSLPPIVFVTPTAYRATQKADLTRLAQTLANMRSLFWIVIEDSDTASPFVDDLLIRLNIQSVHLTALTPPEKKANSSEPVNKFPRGVAQRNAALKWIRENLASWTHGVLYFGDDDNTYDWRLFDEMRTIRRVGVWPVGIVGGTLVETPLLHENNGSVRKFSVLWKPNRQFPIDMAGFALNLSLIHASPAVQFSYQSKRGFMETDFLESLKLSLADLEPKAKKCTKVFVWHTRTERANLGKLDMQKLLTRRALSPLERDVLF